MMEPTLRETLASLTARRDRLRAQEQHAGRMMSDAERLFCERVETAHMLAHHVTTLRAAANNIEGSIRERVLNALDTLPNV